MYCAGCITAKPLRKEDGFLIDSITQFGCEGRKDKAQCLAGNELSQCSLSYYSHHGTSAAYMH